MFQNVTDVDIIVVAAVCFAAGLLGRYLKKKDEKEAQQNKDEASE